jgi:hypothetical protein
MNRPLLPILIPLCLVACTTAVDSLEGDESLLAAAGFRAVYPSSADRIDQLYSLPPGHLLADNAGDHVNYLYADPAHCGCYYEGDEAAHRRLAELMTEKGRADARFQAAQWQFDQAVGYGPMYGGAWGFW